MNDFDQIRNIKRIARRRSLIRHSDCRDSDREASVIVNICYEDRDVIVEALKYYRQRIENYDGYPSYDFKRLQIAKVDAVTEKIRQAE